MNFVVPSPRETEPYTVNSRHSGHPRDHDLVSVIARVRNSGVRENFYFKPYLQKEVTGVYFFRPVVARKERQNFIYKQKNLTEQELRTLCVQY